MAIKKSELYSSLWKSCDELRGGMDASQYKDYVLVLLFVKYVSDKAKSQKHYDLVVPKGSRHSAAWGALPWWRRGGHPERDRHPRLHQGDHRTSGKPLLRHWHSRLRNTMSPMGVADYQLLDALPKYLEAN